MASKRSADLELAELEVTKISHEFHDGLLQWITGAKMHAEALHAECVAGSPVAADQLAHLVDLLAEATVEGRRLLAGLRHPDISTQNWHDALQHWVTVANLSGSTVVHWDLDDSTQRLATELQTVAYRVCQESIGNALKHANARQIHVVSKFEDADFVAIVQDDGCGFNPGNVLPGHFGLQGIRERIALIDGTLRIDSAEDQGTRIEIRFSKA